RARSASFRTVRAPGVVLAGALLAARSAPRELSGGGAAPAGGCPWVAVGCVVELEAALPAFLAATFPASLAAALPACVATPLPVAPAAVLAAPPAAAAPAVDVPLTAAAAPGAAAPPVAATAPAAAALVRTFRTMARRSP